MFKFLDDAKDEVALLIDIGNGSIGTAVASFGKDKVPKILFSARLPFSIVTKIDSAKLQSGMAAVLDEVLEETIKFIISLKGRKDMASHASSVLVTFSSPWFVSKTKHVQITNEKSFIVTNAFFDALIKKEQEIFEKELNGESPESAQTFTIVEKSIVHIKINGYDVHTVIGKKAKSLDAFLCMSVVSNEVVSQVHERIVKHIHIAEDHVIMHTFPLVFFSVVRDLYPTFLDYILMDITGEVTDITLIKAGVIADTVSFPAGRNFIIRYVAKSFDVSPEIALSMLHMCQEGKADETMTNKMKELFVDVEKEWSVYLEDALTSISKNMVVPSKVYLTSDNDVASIFIEFLKLQKTDTTYAFRKNVDVVHVNHEALEKFYTSDSVFSGDEFMAILSIFYSKYMKNR